MSGLPLSAPGYARYRTWRDAPTTAAHDIALVDRVIGAITQTGWPPTVAQWLYFQDPDDHHHWIIAPADTLWVVIRPDSETVEFVTAHHPTPDDDERVPWLTDPDNR